MLVIMLSGSASRGSISTKAPEAGLLSITMTPPFCSRPAVGPQSGPFALSMSPEEGIVILTCSPMVVWCLMNERG